MSRKRLGKRERKARTSKRRAICLRKFAGSTEYVRSKTGRKKTDKLLRAMFKPVSR